MKTHPCYVGAKTGDALQAAQLVADVCLPAYVDRLREQFAAFRNVRLAAVHAEEAHGRNQIAQALAMFVANELGVECEQSLVQLNVVNHTGAGGFARLASQALFGGEVESGCEYVLVDDFVGQGGTLANLRGHLELLGGRVVGGTVLTGKPFSAKIGLSGEMLDALRSKHGSELETWWKEQFGFGFECLTESEARYLVRTPDALTIRNRITEAGQAQHG